MNMKRLVDDHSSDRRYLNKTYKAIKRELKVVNDPEHRMRLLIAQAKFFVAALRANAKSN